MTPLTPPLLATPNTILGIARAPQIWNYRASGLQKHIKKSVRQFKKFTGEAVEFQSGGFLLAFLSFGGVVVSFILDIV